MLLAIHQEHQKTDQMMTYQSYMIYFRIGCLLIRLEVSGSDFSATMECLLKGPTLQGILHMLKRRFSQYPITKVRIDASEAWEDLVAFYKSMRLEVNKQVRIQISGQPVIDVGGVRAQLYTAILDSFSQNKKIRLFEGPPRCLRPLCTVESRSSGLFKVLGIMVGHALSQDGIGFPFWSPLCFWYMFDGEEKALQHLTMDDVGEDVVAFLTEVSSIMILCKYCIYLYRSPGVILMSDF